MSNSDTETRKLLSLDGGGVRGLSTIAILRELMERLALKRNVSEVHPWQEFDMIGGTSTGGLLAIMLGRLRMSIDQCEEVYVDLLEKIFTPQSLEGDIVDQEPDFMNARGKFSNEVLEACIKDVVKRRGFPEDQMFYNKGDDGCKVFVAVIRGEDGGNTVIRSYINPEMPNPLWRYCRIWEAASATSAASTFFDPVTIGPHKQTYVDGTLGSNNPIQLLDRESKEMWPDSDRIFISIGTGTAPGASLDGNTVTLAKRIKQIAVEAEKTHEGFYRDHEKTLVANRHYFRFNVEGLERIRLEEHKARPEIYGATETYLESGAAGTMIKQLVEVLRSAAHTFNTRSENDNSRATSASTQVAARATSLPPPTMTLAEQFQARREREEATKKLFRAVSLNKVAEVKELLEKGADPNVLGTTAGGSATLPICEAAMGKKNEILHLLIQNKAEVDGVSPGSGTALHLAIMFKNQEGVEALLTAGADPNGNPDHIKITSYTPLQYAAQFSDNDPGILQVLLIAGADVNAKSRSGTALDCALRQGQFRTARVLLNKGADPDLISDGNHHHMKNVPVSAY